MDYGLDTSALMRLATQQPPELAERVTARIQSVLDAGAAIHVSDLVVMEAYYALQHSYHATKPGRSHRFAPSPTSLGSSFPTRSSPPFPSRTPPRCPPVLSTA